MIRRWVLTAVCLLRCAHAPKGPPATDALSVIAEAASYPISWVVLSDSARAAREQDAQRRVPGWAVTLDEVGLLQSASTLPNEVPVSEGAWTDEDRARVEAFLAREWAVLGLPGPNLKPRDVPTERYASPRAELIQDGVDCAELPARVSFGKEAGAGGMRLTVVGHFYPGAEKPFAEKSDQELLSTWTDEEIEYRERPDDLNGALRVKFANAPVRIRRHPLLVQKPDREELLRVGEVELLPVIDGERKLRPEDAFIGGRVPSRLDVVRGGAL